MISNHFAGIVQCVPPHLVDLSLLVLGVRRQGGGGRSSLVTQSELSVAEVPVALDVVKRLPDQTLLLQEALVRHQQVQVALTQRRENFINNRLLIASLFRM